MAFALLHSDDFTAADGTTLSGRTMSDSVGTWAINIGTWVINSNAARETAGSANQQIYDSAMSAVGIQKAEAKFVTARDVGPMTRFAPGDASTTKGYLAYCHFSTGAITIYECTGGTLTAIGSGGTAAANDVVSLESDGSSHTARINGSSVATATDSTHATGVCALYSGGLQNQNIDDFADYIEAAGGQPIRKRMGGMVGNPFRARGVW